MPFASEAQRKFLYARHPDIAKRWSHEHPHQGKLPKHVGDKKKKKKPAHPQGHKAVTRHHVKKADGPLTAAEIGAMAAKESLDTRDVLQATADHPFVSMPAVGAGVGGLYGLASGDTWWLDKSKAHSRLKMMLMNAGLGATAGLGAAVGSQLAGKR